VSCNASAHINPQASVSAINGKALTCQQGIKNHKNLYKKNSHKAERYTNAEVKAKVNN